MKNTQKIAVGLAGIIIIIGIIGIIANPGGLTGRVVGENLAEQKIDIMRIFHVNSEFTLEVGKVRGIRMTGEYEGSGSAEIYLKLDEGELLIARAETEARGENDSAPQKKNIDNECIETCSIPETENPEIIVRLTGGKLTVESMTYTYKKENQPPVQLKTIGNITFDNNYTINVSEYFADPENEQLKFNFKNIEELDVKTKDGLITIRSEKAGSYEAYVYALDSDNIVRSNIFTINTGVAQQQDAEPEETTTATPGDNTANEIAEDCNSQIAEGKWFEVRTKQERLMLIDQEGNIFIKGKIDENCGEEPGNKDYVIRAGQKILGFVSREKGDLCIRGEYSGISAQPAGAGNFIVKNTGKETVVFVDAKGDLHAKNVYENCEEAKA